MRGLLACVVVLSSCHGTCRPPTGGPVAEGPVPACRLYDAGPVVGNTMREALRRTRERHPFPYTRTVVNPQGTADDALGLYLVRDARTDAIDEHGCIKAGVDGHGPWDRLTVRNICVADQGRVFCSAAAIEAILREEPPHAAAVSPFLFYAFAHELGHIALGHPGAAFGAPGFSMDLGEASDVKLSSLSNACLVDEEQVNREQQADDEALAELSIAFAQPPFSTGSKDATTALITNAEDVYEASLHLLDWMADYYGSSTPLLAPNAYEVCGLLREQHGHVDLPSLGGNHPHSWRRLGSLMTTTSKLIVSLDPEKAFVVQSNAMTDGIRAYAMEALVRRFCKQVATAQAGELDCGSWTPSTGIPEFTTEELEAAGMPHLGADEHVLTFPSFERAPHCEVSGAPKAQFVILQVIKSVATAEQADALAKDALTHMTEVIKAADAELAAHCGYYVYLRARPITWSYDPLDGSYMVTGSVVGMMRTSANFDVESLPAWRAIPDAVSADVESYRWDDDKGSAIMQFYPARDAGHDNSKRLLTKELPAGWFFDLDAARGGNPGVISADFHHLLCYARARLDARYADHFLLKDTARDGSTAFYLNLRDVGQLDFPETWIGLADDQCPDIRAADPSVFANLSLLADYGTDPQDVSQRDFESIFMRALP